jgi:hypothetical protein
MNRARDYHMALGGSPETWAAILDWESAGRHFDNAAAAAIARDDEAFDREMKAFRSISATWLPNKREELK